ncbi:NAD(P)/FAD-dependent oxidoreductase [Silvibacterium dinghuense]|uniref:FAD-dependent oxidoreductase n=1 Tax=Silvibacterium dinghuense TaxID=1560006 RepID=A0A4Q1S9M3_9BACT|nr:tryptophan 7-halogenase [Silvibacterium dinghuense]RXS93740.1 FAD-dependent oxidoreductase [Silvibacterium dinghuense]GGH07274.1 halogenase [Silvibacterium dinghuense]
MTEPPSSSNYDLAIAGSGFAGSILASIARRLGLSVVILEKGSHPRVVIGESSTPLTALLLEELAAKYDLPTLAAFSKWGSWRREHPEIACGLKRGFTFHHHTPAQPASSGRDSQLLVAASPNESIGDVHWYRADFDHFLLNEAVRHGAVYYDLVHSLTPSFDSEGVTLTATRHDDPVHIRAKFLVDATGPRGFLHRALSLGESTLPGMPATEALYNHFTCAATLESGNHARLNGQPPPYPIDQAAVHHLFPGGWVWVLQFHHSMNGGGITSAGVACTQETAARLNLREGQPAWQRLLEEIPALKEQFAHAKPERAFTHIPQLSFRSAAIVDPNKQPRWALLPSAAGFVDPLLSTGFPLTLLGVSRLAQLFSQHEPATWSSPAFAQDLRTYAEATDTELLAAAHLIAALYANLDDFPVFAALSLLYFAAVSYAETARRLGRADLAPNFLLHDAPNFGPAMKDLCARAQQPRTLQESAALIKSIYRVIEPIDVAGLCDTTRRNWYPVEAADLYANAYKLGVTQEEISALLKRCGF